MFNSPARSSPVNRTLHSSSRPFSSLVSSLQRATSQSPGELDHLTHTRESRTAAWPENHSIEKHKTAKRTAMVGATRESGSPLLEAVFFDLDDTLVLTHAADKSACNAVQVLLAQRLPPLNHQAVVDQFNELFITEPWDPTHQVEVTEWRAKLWNRALLLQGVDDMKLARELQDCFDTERLLAFQWTEGVIRLVKRLQSQGVKVGIITNGHPKVQRAKLKACRAHELFNTILVGGEEPEGKPHKDIFLKACRLVACNPEKAMMVGDNLTTDIQVRFVHKMNRFSQSSICKDATFLFCAQGGLNAGFMATVWVNVHKLKETTGQIRPHHTVTDINDLQQVLKSYQLST